MCFTRVNRLYSVLKKYGSSQTSQYHNKFCDLFAALSLPKVLNIQNLPLHMLTDPTYQRFLQVSFIWHRRFVHCVGFLTMSSLLWRPKKLTFYTGFYSKGLHSPLCSVPGIIYLLRSQPKDKAINEQLGAWSFADTFRTAEKTNLISLWSDDSLNASLWRHIRSFRISRIVTYIFWVCKVFTTRTKEDL